MKKLSSILKIISFFALIPLLTLCTNTIELDEEYSFHKPKTMMVVEQNSRNISNVHGEYNFKYVSPGQSSRKIEFIIKNTGNAELKGIAVSIKGDDSSHFTLKTLNLEKSLKPKGQTKFHIIFEPTDYGRKVAVVEILNSSEVANFTFNIEGAAENRPLIAVRAESTYITYSATGYNYGDHYESTTSAPVTYYIENNGTGPLNNISVSIEGYDAVIHPPYTYSHWTLDTSNLSSTLLPGEQTSFTIAFNSFGRYEVKFGAVSIKNSSEYNPFAFTIRGDCIPDPNK